MSNLSYCTPNNFSGLSIKDIFYCSRYINQILAVHVFNHNSMEATLLENIKYP